ncbi:VOC family protein [Rhodococcus sp. B50]|uniref:VOC family protein n=1 Tax=Rhodococcus sp. B50 TaxID=2682847 RepID=UPI001BD24252|nr:VOC family protein [Rhodococcus sp. B50]MBS9376503.1 hypothetical protein [Rhodococcus sp. B50]
MITSLGSPVQMSFVVPDLDTAMSHWIETADTGPFHAFRRVDDLGVTYRGTPTPLSISIGLAQLGSMHIELIEQHSLEPSVYRDAYAPGHGGFHHLCFPVPDIDATVEQYRDAGFEVGMHLRFGDTPVAYIDTRPAIGCMTELIRNDPEILDLYAAVADSAIGWDGSDPIRILNR